MKSLSCLWRVALASALCMFALRAGAADAVSEQVIGGGAVKTTLTLKVDDLKAFPADQIVSVNVTQRVGDKETATDGYRAVFSWPELFNNEVGAGAVLVFERDGQRLAERVGRIAPISARDLSTGPRSVHWLARLDVKVRKE